MDKILNFQYQACLTTFLLTYRTGVGFNSFSLHNLSLCLNIISSDQSMKKLRFPPVTSCASQTNNSINDIHPLWKLSPSQFSNFIINTESHRSIDYPNYTVLKKSYSGLAFWEEAFHWVSSYKWFWPAFYIWTGARGGGDKHNYPHINWRVRLRTCRGWNGLVGINRYPFLVGQLHI